MALVVFTGRSLTITIDSVDYSIQTAEVTLTPSQTSNQYVSLTSSAATVTPVTWELNLRAFQDWGEAASFCDAMVTAATTGTPISFTLDLPNGGSASGDIIPVYPSVGGAADAALELDYTAPVNGDVTFA